MFKNRVLGSSLLHMMFGLSVVCVMFVAIFNLNLRINSLLLNNVFELKALCLSDNLALFIVNNRSNDQDLSKSKIIYALWKKEVAKQLPMGDGEINFLENSAIIKIYWQVAQEKKSYIATLNNLKNV